MTFPRTAAQYTRAYFVKTKTALLFLTILWPLSNLSGTNLKVGPRKHLFYKLPPKGLAIEMTIGIFLVQPQSV